MAGIYSVKHADQKIYECEKMLSICKEGLDYMDKNEYTNAELEKALRTHIDKFKNELKSLIDQRNHIEKENKNVNSFWKKENN